MNGACAIPPDTGAVRALIATLDCNTRNVAHQGYVALTGGEAFQSGLTLALTIYVALVGYRLLFAPEGARLTDAPRMALKIGAVLALVTSWNLFETLAFDLASQAPAEIAALISPGHSRPSDQDSVGRLQVAYDQLLASASALATQAQDTSRSAVGSAPPTSTPSTAATQVDPAKAAAAQRDADAGRALKQAAEAVLTLDAGAVALDMVVIGLLGAIGPIFVVLLLFDQTRGFFEGWVRALVAAGLASMSAWALVLLMTNTLDPWLVTLAQQRELKALQPAPAMTAAAIVFVFTAAQLAMVAGSAAIAFGFRLGRAPWSPPAGQPAGPTPEATERDTSASMVSRTSLLADQLRRFDAMIETRSRAAMAPSVRLVGPGPLAQPRLAGDGYRRVEFARDRLGRRGSTR
jgi:type IV secretion system protein VirB6